MRAVVVTRSGGPEVLEVRDEPEPTAGPGKLLVDVEAIGINFRDIYEREGNYGGPPPLIAGVEGCGTVAGTGERVAWVAVPGSYAERVAVDAAKAVPVPDGISPELGAGVLLQGMTAHYLARSTYPVGPGDTVVVHAAAGGVGLLLTQIVKLAGGMVIGTTSSDEKAELARAAGADHVIGYDGFAEQVRDLTGGKGASVVYDGIGAATFAESLKALRPRGLAVLFGAAQRAAASARAGRARTCRVALRDAPDAHALHAHARGAARTRERCLRLDPRREARGQDRQNVPARAGATGAGGPPGTENHRQADPPAGLRTFNRTSTGHRAALCTHAAASSVAAIALLSPLPASLHRTHPSHPVGAWSFS